MRRAIAVLCLLLAGSLAVGGRRADLRALTPQAQPYRVFAALILDARGPLPPDGTELVRIAGWCSQWDAPGDDAENLTQEWVCIQNDGDRSVQMQHWQLRDLAGMAYRFPQFELHPHSVVRLHTGVGSDTNQDLYWGLANAVWNNDGDTAILYDATGILVSVYQY